MWPTILLSVVGLVVLLSIPLPGPENQARLIAYAINIEIGALLTYWQTPAYKQWAATHGGATARQSGCLIPAVVALGTVALVLFLVLGPPLLPISRANAAIDHYNRGVEHQEQGRWRPAIEEYTQAIELDPQLAEAHLNRGNAHIQVDDYDRAIDDLDQAIALNPKFAEAYHNRGLAHALNGDYDRAIEDLDQAIVLNPQDATTYFLRGVVYAEIGQREKAVADLEKALTLGLEPDQKQNAETLLEQLTP